MLTNELSDLRSKYRDKKLVFVSGVFNIVHPGHVRLLNFARECGDVLIVGLFCDDSPGVMLGFEDRKSALIAMESVREVVQVAPEDLAATLGILRPTVVVKGKEHETLSNPEGEVLSSYGGHLIFASGDQKFSSRDLIRREFEGGRTLQLQADNHFLQEHGLAKQSMLDRISGFAGARVCVLGDLILDEYVYCDPLGMSQEDPTIVVTPVESKRFVGGAGIVAAHLTGLGAETRYFSIVGADDTGRLAEKLLREYGVECIFVNEDSRPTTLKQRFRAQNKTLLRVSHLRSHEAGREYWEALLADLKASLAKTDLVVFSDFNYGCLPQSFVDEVCDLCRRKSVPYVADSQASSQLGDIGRFVGADFLSATEREARLAMNDFRSGLQNVANMLFSKAKVRGLFVKLGAEGMIIVGGEHGQRTSSLSALNPNPVDVVGAGDAFLAASALCRVSGASLAESAYVGSVAAGIQVSRIGNLPLGQSELLAQLTG